MGDVVWNGAEGRLCVLYTCMNLYTDHPRNILSGPSPFPPPPSYHTQFGVGLRGTSILYRNYVKCAEAETVRK